MFTTLNKIDISSFCADEKQLNRYFKFQEFAENVYGYHSKQTGFFDLLDREVISELGTQPALEGFRKASELSTEYGLDIESTIEPAVFSRYVSAVNAFSNVYSPSDIELKYEIMSSYIAFSKKPYENFNTTFNRSIREKSVDTLFTLACDPFYGGILYNKLKKNGTYDAFVKSASELYKNFATAVNERDFSAAISSVKGDIDNLIKTDTVEEIIVSEAFASLDSDMKMEILSRYNESVRVYNVKVFESSKMLLDSLGFDSFFNAESQKISYLTEKYRYLQDQLSDKETTACRVLKTVLYAAIYLLRDTKPNDLPFKFMNNIVGVNSSWATGTAKTFDASFYGNSDFAKASYAYYNFMQGKENPYLDIINNATVDEMDENGIAMHRYFVDNKMSEILYDLIFGKNSKYGVSIYEALYNIRDVIDIIEQPINASSLYNDALTMFKGIISSIINSALGAIDLAISGTSRSLFYAKFIPIQGEKYSIADIHNYAMFLKIILEAFQDDGEITEISKEDFINAAYAQLGINKEIIKRIGYCSYDMMLNSKYGLDIYNKYFEKDQYGVTITAKTHMKVLYSLIQFSIQKQNAANGVSLVAEDDYGNIQKMKSLLRYLDEDEIYFVMKTCAVDFEELNEYTRYYEENVLDFNQNTLDISFVYNHDSKSTAFYDAFRNTNRQVLIVERQASLFDISKANQMISGQLSLYVKTMSKNSVNIKDAMFDANGISNIDDFIMRFLPSIVELSKTLGINVSTIKQVTDLLEYICTIITEMLFKELFFGIKTAINDKLMAFSEDMFKKIDKYMIDDVIIRFDINGTYIKDVIDKIIKMIEKGIPLSGLIQNCFINDGYGFKYDFTLDNSLSFESALDAIGGNGGESYEDLISKWEESLNGGTGGGTGGSGGGTGGSSWTDGSYTGSVTIPGSIDSSFDGSLSEKEIIEIIKKPGYTIEEMETIKDKVSNITNKDIMDNMNNLEKLKDDLNFELNKNKPNYGIIKDLNSSIKNLENKIEILRKESNTLIFGTEGTIINGSSSDGNASAFVDFKNKDYNLKEVIEVLGKIEEVVLSEAIPLTNFEIIQLLK